MHIFHRIEDIRPILANFSQEKKTIGLVPTMGALHKGHLSLIKASRQNCAITVATIFVNPTQFNQSNDIEQYPRDLENDIKKLEIAGTDLLFVPDVKEMYPNEPILSMDFGALEEIMEGKFRPGHFSGVGLVVAKLFNIIRPSQAYFGQKDLQQFIVIKQMAEELCFPIRLNMMPIIRENSGLAMSSRNRRLSERQLGLAANLFKSLNEAKQMLLSGMPVREVIEQTKAYFAEIPDINLEYFDIVDLETLKSINQLNPEEPLALCLACYLGDIRLIDNIVIARK